MQGIWQDIRAERRRQEDLHGDESIIQRDAFQAYAILGEEVGELGTAILKLHDAMPVAGPKDFTAALNHMRAEAVQVAACAVAMIEAVDGGRYG
jgi:NTP pyrophosphatase (non-canonical NTP hydrolase)